MPATPHICIREACSQGYCIFCYLQRYKQPCRIWIKVGIGRHISRRGHYECDRGDEEYREYEVNISVGR